MKRFTAAHQRNIQEKYWKKTKKGRRQPDHPVVYATFEPLASYIASQVQNPHICSVLEVGCGNGFLTYVLEKRFNAVTCLDYSEEMLQINPCSGKLIASSTDVPFADNTFDVVVASHLLHHLVEEERIKTLQEMARVTRKTIVLIEPNRNNPFMFLFSLLMKEERMALEFSRYYMSNLLNQLRLRSHVCQVKGWIVPNKAPVWWIPIGQFLARTPLQYFGFDIVCTALLNP